MAVPVEKKWHITRQSRLCRDVLQSALSWAMGCIFAGSLWYGHIIPIVGVAACSLMLMGAAYAGSQATYFTGKRDAFGEAAQIVRERK